MHRRALLSGYLLLAAGSPAAAQTESLATRIDGYLAPFIATNNFSGVVRITRQGKVIYQRAAGMADPAFGVRIDSTTRFHLASISKAFTAAAILRLQDQGLLDTRNPVSRYLPGYPRGDELPLRDLLRHMSGIPNVDDFPELAPDRYVPYPLDALVRTFRDKPLDFAPGTRARYTNSDYNLLALIMETVTGRDYGDVIAQEIARPLSLRSLTHDGDARVVLPFAAAGTEPDGLRGVRYVPYLKWSTKTGSGSLVATAGDLCRFADGLFGGKLMSSAALREVMDTTGVFPYGWDQRDVGSHRARGVGGRSPGFIADVEYLYDEGVCLAVLTNSYSSVGQVIAPDLMKLTLGLPATPPPIAYHAPAAEALRAFTGRFRMPANYYAPNAVVTLLDRGSHLDAQWEGGFVGTFYPTGGDDFVDRTNWAMVHFQRDRSGQVVGFRYDLLRRFEAVRIGN